MMLEKFYLWIETSNGHQAAGNLYGYNSLEELKDDRTNQDALRLYDCIILRATPYYIVTGQSREAK